MLEKKTRSKDPKKADEKPYDIKRSLIHKKFVTNKDLTIIFAFCLLYILIQITWLKSLPSWLIFLIELPMLLIVWHRSYQILFDFKLLFFDNRFDVKIEYPKGKVLPTITFIIPSCQEPFSVAKMTFDSIVDAPYNGNKEIIIVDNSNNVVTKDFIDWKNYVENYSDLNPNESISTRFLYNEKKDTLKPGNLDLGQQFIQQGEFVVFLDVDSTLPDQGNLLEQSVAQFEADCTLGFVQFRIKATNNHFNSLTQGVAVSQDLLRLRMISRGYGGYKIFEGHNGVWRKTVLDSSGPWTEYFRGNIIITEDILKSAHAYSAGYYGKPLNVETGEWVPSSLLALESMWMRWMYGNSQVFIKCFRKIYTKKITVLEMFDISYHMTSHLVVIFFFLIAILLQLFVLGPITNIFVFLFGIFPQLISAITSYFTSVRKLEMPMIKKIKCIYTAFFLIETFIMCIQVKSDIRFILGRRQGWKVTEKGVEHRIGWKNLMRNNSFYFGMAIFSLVFCAISWVYNYNMAFNSIHYHFALLFVNINLLCCIITYGKQRRKSYNNVESAAINNSNLNESSKPELAKIEVF
ncbi:glycosyltransferase [Mucilaginibacter lappiensis]|uniref:Glycosyltransferase 2-like domain-containing protein n=1 Tax=Mucilaginibacter lappiensis TaxID=354630 RepID=A0A841JQD5_9SPHI|nr:glycosyltransferase family 2 protein [Mucilaginibacter lappiensis]MBB6131826.1 hypothetical protein [Mucilaginibacter lappiensis]